MGSLSGDNNCHARRTRVTMELLKGKKTAIQLQRLLLRKQTTAVEEEGGPVSPQELALQIWRSFNEILSEFSSCTASTQSSPQIAAVSCGGSAFSGESKKKVKDRRGCYKRRKTSDSWVTVSSTIEDGCAWRKYGQKSILNSEYPRCYFRCTHKSGGCKATKQVQMIKEDPILYQTTYSNHHTCTETLRAPHDLIVDSDPIQPNLISFQANINHDNIDNNTLPSKQSSLPNNPIMNISAVKQEDSTQSDVSEAKSTLLQDPWQDIWHKPVWAPVTSASDFHSCESTSFHGLDIEVDQLGDMESLNYFINEIC